MTLLSARLRASGAMAAALLLLIRADAPQQDANPEALLDTFLRMLDVDGDGSLGPYEATDSLSLLIEEADMDEGVVSTAWLASAIAESRSEELEDRALWFEEFARGKEEVELAHVEFIPSSRYPLLDSNGDGVLTREEWMQSSWYPGVRDFLEAEFLGFLADLDQDNDEIVSAAELKSEFGDDAASVLEELDSNQDGKITRAELQERIDEEAAGARFDVEGRTAIMRGTIHAGTPGRVMQLLVEHPQVDTIVMEEVPGSMDDHANLRAARLIRRAGLATHLPADGEVASGGTDLFLAGAKRTAEPGARFGIHSWADGFDGRDGADFPRDAEEHQMYLQYYREMGIPEDFYWRTLEAAPASDIHWMTPEELERFDFFTDEPEAVGLRTQVDWDSSDSPKEIMAIPEDAPYGLTRTFQKYTRLLAPNGKPIHFFAQSGVSDEQLVRAREVMRFYLTDVPGSRFGEDKRSVANAMADRSAAMVYFNSERDAERAIRGRLGDAPFFFQDLYATESVVEGSQAYQDHSVRDATLEEVFHLVQGAGIQPAMPEYHARIEEAMRNAVDQKIWFTNEEWEAEGSSSFEYIISVIDVAYGLWAHDPHGNGESFHGEYVYCRPEDLPEGDPLGLEVLHEFLPKHFSFPATVASDFEGTFQLAAGQAQSYTLKSRFLTDVSLSGDRHASLQGGAKAELLRGDASNNRLAGGGGDDTLIGGDGVDTAVFQGNREEYQVLRHASGLILVADLVPSRDGTDRLEQIEKLEFADG